MSDFTNFPNGITIENGAHVATLQAVEALPGAFTGSANARGDYDGTDNPTTLFTVTGKVLALVFGKVTTDLAGASATIEVGITGNTAAILAQQTGTDLDAGEIWTNDASAPLGTVGNFGEFVLLDGTDIIETVATANLTGGVIEYTCLWYPLESGASVVAA